MNLLERAPFLEELDELLRRAASGQGRLVFLGGEAGVGKTVLIQRFCQSVEKTAKVLVGACDPLSTPRPLGPLLDIAVVMGGELERLLQTPGQRDGAFRSFLASLTGLKTTVVVFEDVHWADEATLDLLRFLGRRLGTTRTLLIATYRDDEVGPKHPLRVVMGDLTTSAAIRRLALPPFSKEAVRSLTEGTELDPAELHRQTGGNPFFVTEVLASGADGIPSTVRDAILARAARLLPEGRATLEAAAVIGSRIEPWLLAEIAGSRQGAVEACMEIGMLRSQGTALALQA